MGSTSASTESSRDTVLVGVVSRAHGIRGEVKVEITSDVDDRFEPGRELLLKASGRSPVSVRVASFRRTRGGGIVRFDGWLTRDQAEEIRGSRLEVELSEVPAAPAGSYYHFELLGCRCFDAELGDLGEVSDVVEDGGGVLLEVARAGRVLPIPFVEAFLESVDVASREIRFRLPPGLVETCESRS